MLSRLVYVTAFLVLVGPAAALEEPVVWRDPDTGCAYLLTPAGGIALRLRRNGTPDCPDAANAGVIDDAWKGIARGLDALQREVERLRDGADQRR